MLRIRFAFKMGPNHQPNSQLIYRNKEWTCCFGIHVHTATILIGLWHLFLNILALSLLAVIWRNPHMMEELENSYDYNVDLNAPALPTPLSKVDPPYAYRDHSLNYQNFDMGGLVCTCMIAITLMMIYGTIKGKPSHLLPFFCLQLFDFAITTLTAAGYLCYLQAIHRLIAESHRLPWREKLLELSPEELVIVVLVVFVCIVFLKAYAIGIVWRCYKYLTLRQQTMRTLLPCGLNDMPGAQMGAEEQRAYSTLLPNYDEAITQYMKQAPPPSYQVAMAYYQEEENALNASAAAAAAARANLTVVIPSVAVVNNNADNNNVVPNNNNTCHINANTPTMARNEMAVAVADNTTDAANLPGAVNNENDADEDDEQLDVRSTDSTPPPSYNTALVMNGTTTTTTVESETNSLQQSPVHSLSNESQA